MRIVRRPFVSRDAVRLARVRWLILFREAFKSVGRVDRTINFARSLVATIVNGIKGGGVYFDTGARNFGTVCEIVRHLFWEGGGGIMNYWDICVIFWRRFDVGKNSVIVSVLRYESGI